MLELTLDKNLSGGKIIRTMETKIPKEKQKKWKGR
jgi:hypothetical protein